MLIRRGFWVGLFSVTACAAVLASIKPAAAETLSKSGKITITGIVPPAKYVMLDSNLYIKQVVSNFAGDANPVFLTNTAPPKLVPPTPQLLQAYYSLKSQYNFLRLGVVYDASLVKLKISQAPPVSDNSNTKSLLGQANQAKQAPAELHLSLNG